MKRREFLKNVAVTAGASMIPFLDIYRPRQLDHPILLLSSQGTALIAWICTARARTGQAIRSP